MRPYWSTAIVDVAAAPALYDGKLNYPKCIHFDDFFPATPTEHILQINFGAEYAPKRAK